MGAYGSPELHPPEQQSYSNYPQYPQYSQYPYKPKTHHLAFFIGGLAVGIVLASLLYQNSKTTPVQAVMPVSSQLVTAMPYRDDSRDYLKGWAKIAVLKCLVNPSSANFLDDDTGWTFSQNGDICTVSSMVILKNRDRTAGKGLFEVKIQYDNFNAKVIFVQIGDKVAYDASKQK